MEKYKSKELSIFLVLLLLLQIIALVQVAIAEEYEKNITNNAGKELTNSKNGEEILTNTDNYIGEDTISTVEDGSLEDSLDYSSNEKEINTTSPVLKDNKGFNLILDKATKGPNDETFSEDSLLDPLSQFFVHYSWSLDNGHGYEEGDIIEFDLPKGLIISTEARGDLSDGTGNVFANYKVLENGKIQFVFTSIVNSLSQISGDFYIASKLNSKVIEIEDEKVVIGEDNEMGKLEIPVDIGNLSTNISKEGNPIPAYSPKEIEWSINVDSGILKHKNGLVTDVLPKGLSYKPGSIRIDGKEVTEPKISGQELEIDLGDFKGQKVIKIKTLIDEDYMEESSFYNAVYYEPSNINEKVESWAQVDINRGKPLTKKQNNYDKLSQEIEWEIELNYDIKEVKETVLKDSWDEDLMNLVDGSFEIYNVTIDKDGKVTKGDKADLDFNISQSNNEGFSVDIPSINKPYLVKYKTKLKDRLLEDKYISNKAEWNGTTSIVGGTLGQAVGRKENSNPNYKEKTVDWIITANEDKKQMKNFVIKDRFGQGLQLKKDSILVTLGGKELEECKQTEEISEDSKVNLNKEDTTICYILTKNENGFTISFDTEEISDVVEVKYTTSFDYSELEEDYFKNNADFQWITKNNDKPWIKEVESTFTPDDYTKNDGNKSGYYNAKDKTITWTIGVNYQQNSYKNLVIKDLIKGNQKLIEDSIKVYEARMSGNSNSIEKDKEVDKFKITKLLVDHQEGFTIDLGKTDKAYVIVYKTSLDGLNYIQKEYDNTASIYDGENKKTDLNDSIGIHNGGKYGSKSGVQNGKIIDWTVNINESQATIKEVTLTDKLSSNQEFLKDTIKVYETIVDSNGYFEKGSEYKNVKINISEDQILEIVFNETIDRPYIVEYSSLYFGVHGDEVSNQYTVNGKNLSNQGEKEGQEQFSIQQLTGGSASGEVGYLRIEKVASFDENHKLEGVKFNLIDGNSNKLIKTGVTDKKGNIDFGKLMYGDYLLEEVNTPEGYIKPSAPYPVTIDKPYLFGDNDKKGNFEVIRNEKEVNAFKIIKSDLDNPSIRLEGAEFNLYKSNGELVVSGLKTDELGELVYGLENGEDLEEGSYYIQEVKAPKGYLILDDKLEFQIKDGDRELVILDIKNEIHLVNLKLFKKDIKNNNPLKDARFILLDEEGKRVVEKDLITDEKGIVEVKDLQEGVYYIEEVQAPNGYQRLPEAIKVELTSSVLEEKVVEISNAPLGHAQIIKLREGSKDPIQGVTFRLDKLDLNGVWQEIEEVITDENGLAFSSKLDLGKYRYVEIGVPEKVILDETPIEFIVNEDNFIKDRLSFIVENKYFDTILSLTKVDKDKPSRKLSGAEFSLYKVGDSSKEELVESGLRTDDSGRISVIVDEPGKYYFVETKAPEGYRIDREKQEITVERGYEAEIIVSNEEEPSVILPNIPISPDKPSEEIEEPEKPIDKDKPEEEKPENPWEDKPEVGLEEPEEELEDLEDESNIPSEKEDEELVDDSMDENKTKPSLPKTGQVSNKIYFGLGLLFIMLGLFLFKKDNK